MYQEQFNIRLNAVQFNTEVHLHAALARFYHCQINNYTVSQGGSSLNFCSGIFEKGLIYIAKGASSLHLDMFTHGLRKIITVRYA